MNALAGNMEEFQRDLSRLKNLPVLDGEGSTQAFTRAVHVLVNNVDMLETIRGWYCDLPISPMLRGISSIEDAEQRVTEISNGRAAVATIGRLTG